MNFHVTLLESKSINATMMEWKNPTLNHIAPLHLPGARGPLCGFRALGLIVVRARARPFKSLKVQRRGRSRTLNVRAKEKEGEKEEEEGKEEYVPQEPGNGSATPSRIWRDDESY